MIEVSLLLWLLLPVAATSGWFAARRGLRAQETVSRPSLTRRRLSSDYLQGLNYLLNEQPDKAIDVFIKLIDVDSETVETHLALGALFRRRGEVNRAIRIHQNLLTKAELSTQQRSLALLELGQDYQRAGLLDRAEDLYRELGRSGQYQVYAHRQLLDIYQQEHEWPKAVATAEKLAELSGENLNPIIAQHYCEQAEAFRKQGQRENMYQALRQALRVDPNCVRASLLLGHEALEQGEPEDAIQVFRRVEQQDPVYLPEIIEPLQRCYQLLGQSETFTEYLYQLLQHHHGLTPMLMLAQLICHDQGEQQAADFVIQQLRRRPSIRGLACFVDLVLPRADSRAREHLLVVRDVVGQLLRNRPVYKCHQCGFNGKSLHWQCPSCRQWNTVKPIQGMEGE